jgi:NAD(P)H-hydrate epimerase
MDLANKLVSVQEMVAIEQEADGRGLSYADMMENAGRGLAETIQNEYGFLAEEGALALVGTGNNGGDALVALCYLAREGWDVSAYLVKARPADDPLLARFSECGGKLQAAEEDADFQRLNRMLAENSLLLDGVLGTGIRLPLRGSIQNVLAHVQEFLYEREEPPVVVAVDCPSGIDCDSGEAAPETLPADLTVTMAAVKQGLLKFPAYELTGDLHLVGIGLTEDLPAWQKISKFVVSYEDVQAVLPERPLDAHKGTFGTALVIAGSLNYTGAAYLSGRAAYLSGAGLVTMAVPAPLHAVLAGGFPEATWLLLPHEMGVIAKTAVPVIQEHLKKVSAILIGPGFGLEETSQEFIKNFLNRSNGQAEKRSIGFVHASQSEDLPDGQADLPPIVFDADGLKLLANIKDWYQMLPAPAVLTPHPGEMAQISGVDKDTIQGDRLGIAQRFAQEWGHVLVLKGANTVVASPVGQAAVIPVASAALARAGTGDVLAGLIAGLLAQGVAAFPAAVAAAWIHANAGLTAAELIGNTACVLAGDVLEAIPLVMEDFA